MITLVQQKVILDKMLSFNPKRIGIFGSYVRGEHTTQSDLDILVDFYGRVNLLELVGLEQELSDLLGIKVDLITERSLTDSLKKYVMNEVIFFYE